MELDTDETGHCPPRGANFVASAVMAVMLLIVTVFLGQLPEARTGGAKTVAIR